MPDPTILISGASIAGPAIAFWLLRAGFKVTVVEQAAELRRGGNGVGTPAEALAVIDRMGTSVTVRQIMVERSIAVEVGRRTDVDPATEIMPRLAAPAVVASIRTAVQFWLEGPAAGSLRTALDEATKQFRVGEGTSIGGR